MLWAFWLMGSGDLQNVSSKTFLWCDSHKFYFWIQIRFHWKSLYRRLKWNFANQCIWPRGNVCSFKYPWIYLVFLPLSFDWNMNLGNRGEECWTGLSRLWVIIFPFMPTYFIVILLTSDIVNIIELLKSWQGIQLQTPFLKIHLPAFVKCQINFTCQWE